MIRFYREPGSSPYTVYGADGVLALTAVSYRKITRFLEQLNLSSPLITADAAIPDPRYDIDFPEARHEVVRLSVFISMYEPQMPFAYLHITETRLRVLFLPVGLATSGVVPPPVPFAGDDSFYTEDIFALWCLYEGLNGVGTAVQTQRRSRIKRADTESQAGPSSGVSGRRLVFIDDDLFEHFIRFKNPAYMTASYMARDKSSIELYKSFNPILIQFMADPEFASGKDIVKFKKLCEKIDNEMKGSPSPKGPDDPDYNDWTEVMLTSTLNKLTGSGDDSEERQNREQLLNKRAEKLHEENKAFITELMKCMKESLEKLEKLRKSKDKKLIKSVCDSYKEQYNKLMQQYHQELFRVMDGGSLSQTTAAEKSITTFIVNTQVIESKTKRSKLSSDNIEKNFILYASNQGSVEHFNGSVYFVNHGRPAGFTDNKAKGYAYKLINVFKRSSKLNELSNLKKIYFLSCFTNADAVKLVLSTLKRESKQLGITLPNTVTCYYFPFRQQVEFYAENYNPEDLSTTFGMVIKHNTVPSFFQSYFNSYVKENLYKFQLSDTPLEFDLNGGFEEAMISSRVLREETFDLTDDHMLEAGRQSVKTGIQGYENALKIVEKYISGGDAAKFVDTVTETMWFGGEAQTAYSRLSLKDIAERTFSFISGLEKIKSELKNIEEEQQPDKLAAELKKLLANVIIFPIDSNNFHTLCQRVVAIITLREGISKSFEELRKDAAYSAKITQISPLVFAAFEERIVENVDDYKTAYDVDIRDFLRKLAAGGRESEVLYDFQSYLQKFRANISKPSGMSPSRGLAVKARADYTQLMALTDVAKPAAPDDVWSENAQKRLTAQLQAEPNLNKKQRLLNTLGSLNDRRRGKYGRAVHYMRKGLIYSGHFMGLHGLVNAIRYGSYTVHLTGNAGEDYLGVSYTVMFYQSVTDYSLAAVEWTLSLKRLKFIRESAFGLRTLKFFRIADKFSAGLDIILAPAIIYGDIVQLEQSHTIETLALGFTILLIDIISAMIAIIIFISLFLFPVLAGVLLLVNLALALVSFFLGFFLSAAQERQRIKELDDNLIQSYEENYNESQFLWLIGGTFIGRQNQQGPSHFWAGGRIIAGRPDFLSILSIDRTYQALDVASFTWLPEQSSGALSSENTLPIKIRLEEKIDYYDLKSAKPHIIKRSDGKYRHGGLFFVPRAIPGSHTYDFAACSDFITYVFNALPSFPAGGEINDLVSDEEFEYVKPYPITIKLSRGGGLMAFNAWEPDKGIPAQSDRKYTATYKMTLMFREARPLTTYKIIAPSGSADNGGADSRITLDLRKVNKTPTRFKLDMHWNETLDLSGSDACIKLKDSAKSGFQFIKEIFLPAESEVVTPQGDILLHSQGKSCFRVTGAANKLMIATAYMDRVFIDAAGQPAEQEILLTL
jgi:hypothetical protein